MLRRCIVAAVVLALASGATSASPIAAKPDTAVAAHRLIVVVKKNLPPAAEKRLAVLILVGQNGGPPAAAVATASKALTVLLDNRGLYRVKAEIDTSCTGTCAGSYRVSGSANHKLEIVPTCRPRGAGFVCNKVTLVKIY